MSEAAKKLEKCMREVFERLMRASAGVKPDEDSLVKEALNEVKKNYPAECRAYAEELFQDEILARIEPALESSGKGRVVGELILLGPTKGQILSAIDECYQVRRQACHDGVSMADVVQDLERVHPELAAKVSHAELTDWAELYKGDVIEGRLETKVRFWIAESFERCACEAELSKEAREETPSGNATVLWDPLSGSTFSNDAIVEDLKKRHPVECQLYARAEGDAKIHALVRQCLCWDLGVPEALTAEDIVRLTPAQRAKHREWVEQGYDALDKVMAFARPYMEGYPNRTLGEALKIMARSHPDERHRATARRLLAGPKAQQPRM